MKTIDVNDVRNFYDRFWDPTNEHAQLEHDYWTFQVEARAWAYEQLGPLTGKDILEIGPGLGQDTVTLAQGGANLTVIDVSEPGLAVARRAVEMAGVLDCCVFEKRDAQATGYPDNSFDGVFARGVSMHVEHIAFLRELARIVRPGGRVVLIDPLKYHPVINLYRLSVSSCKESNPQYRTLRDMEAGAHFFGSWDHREFYLNSVLALVFRNAPAIYQRVTRPLQHLDRITLDALPFLRPFAWTAVFAYRK